MFFCMLVFLLRTKRKRNLPYKIAAGCLVLHVLHVLFFFNVSFAFQEVKELGQEVEKLKKVSFCFWCL